MRFSTILEGETTTDVDIILATFEYYVRLAAISCTLGIYCCIVCITYFQIYDGIALPVRDGVQTIACSEQDRSEINFPILT